MNIILLSLQENHKYLSKESEKEKYFDIFYYDMIKYRNYIAAIQDNKVIGLLAFTEKSFFDENCYGMSFVSVHKEYQNLGISSKLIDKLFEIANFNNKGIRITDFTKDGLQKVKHVINRNILKYPNMKIIFA